MPYLRRVDIDYNREYLVKIPRWSILITLRITQYSRRWMLRILSTMKCFRDMYTIYTKHYAVFLVGGYYLYGTLRINSKVEYYLYYALRSFFEGRL